MPRGKKRVSVQNRAHLAGLLAVMKGSMSVANAKGVRIKAINVRRYPPYAALDKETGRCRINHATVKSLFPEGILTGSIIKIKLDGIASRGSITALCTIWPDTQSCLDDGTLCLDISSITLTKTSRTLDVDTLYDWTETDCEVVERSALKPLSSLWYQSTEKLDVSHLMGYVVDKDSRVAPFQTKSLVNIMKINPSIIGIVTSNTIVIQDLTQRQEFSVAQLPHARTAAVDLLIHRTIQPLLAGAPAQTRVNGVLLQGPPGVGKTYALKAVQALVQDQCHVRIVNVSIPDLLADVNPTAWLQDRLKEASRPPVTSSSAKPSITYLLLDEVDALGSNLKQSWAQIAIKETLFRWLDGNCNQASHACCLVGTTNRAADVDPSLRRGGRFELELTVLSTSVDRLQLLEAYLMPLLSSKLPEHPSLCREVVKALAKEFAERAGGYVAADLTAVVREITLASLISPSLTTDQEELVSYWRGQLLAAMKAVPPSCLRGLALQLPRLTFDDVIGCAEAKASITRVFAFFQPEMQARLAKFGLDQALGGVLLYGPPGNSKTRLVAAAAASYGLPMLTLSSADIYSAYLGDAEAEVRKAFAVARQAAPCVLFFDELDSLVTHRAQVGTSTAHSTEARVLATFLNEMDGVCGAAGKRGVIVMGATNRLDCIDPALIRKGRFYQTIHVAPPTASERHDLVRYFWKRYGLMEEPGVLMEGVLGKLWEGMSGAEVENLVKEVALHSHSALDVQL